MERSKRANAAEAAILRNAAPPPICLPPFPKDVPVITVTVAAKLLDCAPQRITDAIEEGELQAIDISKGPEVETFVAGLAHRLNIDVITLSAAIAATRKQARRLHTFPRTASGRRYWRIPREAYEDFIQRRHSITNPP